MACMTDRDAINAVFNAVCALAEKLTGERLQFEMRLAKRAYRLGHERARPEPDFGLGAAESFGAFSFSKAESCA